MGELVLLFFLILLLNIVDSIFILRYHQHLYGAVCWNRWKFAIRLVIVVLAATVMIFAIPAMILWGMVLASSAWMGAYQGGKKNKVLFQVVLISLAVLSFILSFTIAIAFFKDEITIGIFTILASHVIFAVMAETTRHFNQSVLVDLPRKMWLVLLSIPAASLICVPAFSRMVALNGDNASGIGRNQVIILFAVFFINIMVFYLFGKFSELLSTRIDAAVLKQQIKMQEKYYLAVEENHAKVRLLQHDMRNQINAITTMFEEKQMENLGQYLKEIGGQVNQIEKIIVTGNSSIDTILNIKISELIGYDVKVSTNILLPKGIRMDFCEAATLLGNLLDNVMDECLQLPKEKREAKIQISYTNHIMFIRISNPMAVAEKQLPLKSEKTDSELHGFGMKSVQQVVDQFNGTIKLIAQDYLFQISIVLYNV